METELRSLVGHYGFQAVREGLEKEMRETYTYLHSYFQRQHIHTNLENTVILPQGQMKGQGKAKDVLLTTTIPQTIHVEKEICPATEPATDEKTVSLGSSQSNPNPTQSKKKGKQVSLTKVEPPPQPISPPQEQQSNPEALLTKENLEGWLKDGKSFAEIARDTGNNKTVVSGIAKGYGLTAKVKPYAYKKKKQ